MTHPKGRERSEDDEFICGFACAIASLARDHGMPTMARDIAQCNGLDLRDFKRSGVEDFDLNPLKAAFK